MLDDLVEVKDEAEDFILESIWSEMCKNAYTWDKPNFLGFFISTFRQPVSKLFKQYERIFNETVSKHYMPDLKVLEQKYSEVVDFLIDTPFGERLMDEIKQQNLKPLFELYHWFSGYTGIHDFDMINFKKILESSCDERREFQYAKFPDSLANLKKHLGLLQEYNKARTKFPYIFAIENEVAIINYSLKDLEFCSDIIDFLNKLKEEDILSGNIDLKEVLNLMSTKSEFSSTLGALYKLAKKAEKAEGKKLEQDQVFFPVVHRSFSLQESSRVFSSEIYIIPRELYDLMMNRDDRVFIHRNLSSLRKSLYFGSVIYPDSLLKKLHKHEELQDNIFVESLKFRVFKSLLGLEKFLCSKRTVKKDGVEEKMPTSKNPEIGRITKLLDCAHILPTTHDAELLYDFLGSSNFIGLLAKYSNNSIVSKKESPDSSGFITFTEQGIESGTINYKTYFPAFVLNELVLIARRIPREKNLTKFYQEHREFYQKLKEDSVPIKTEMLRDLADIVLELKDYHSNPEYVENVIKQFLAPNIFPLLSEKYPQCIFIEEITESSPESLVIPYGTNNCVNLVEMKSHVENKNAHVYALWQAGKRLGMAYALDVQYMGKDLLMIDSIEAESILYERIQKHASISKVEIGKRIASGVVKFLTRDCSEFLLLPESNSYIMMNALQEMCQGHEKILELTETPMGSSIRPERYPYLVKTFD